MPTYTTDQVVEMTQLATAARDWLDELRSPGSRFYELQAYAFLVNLLPTGVVPADQNGIALCLQRYNDMIRLLEILAAYTDDSIDGNAGGSGSGEIPVGEDDCTALVNAINELSNSLNITQTVSNVFDEYVQIIVDSLTPSFTTINDNVISGFEDTWNIVQEGDQEILLRIQDTRIELREARERLIEIQGANKDNEILQRIEDTRIELREARERLIRVEECVCPRQDEVDYTELVNNIESRIDILLDRRLTDLYLQITEATRIQFEATILALKSYIDSPAWLGNVLNLLQNINTNLLKLDQLLDLLRVIQSYLNEQFTILKNEIQLIKDIVENIDTNLSLTYDLVENILNQVKNLDQVISLINDLRLQEQDNSRITHSLLNTALAILSLLDQKLDEVDPLMEGSLIAQQCSTSQILPFSGRGLFGIRDQITALSLQLNLIHQDFCNAQLNNNELEGIIQTYNCETKTVTDLSFSGTGNQLLINGLQTLSQALLPTQKQVCDVSGECFVLSPTDVLEELTLERQLILHWREDNNLPLRQAIKWTSKIDDPIDNLDWCTHLDQIRWIGGNITIRQYFIGTETRLGGYFLDEESGLETMEQLISLTKMQRRTPVPRITKNGSTFIQTEGIVRRIYKAVIADIIDGKPTPIICLKRPPQGCP